MPHSSAWATTRRRVRHWMLLIGGWTFLVLGVLGLFLPFLQGILFMLIGLLMLSQVSPRLRLRRVRLRRRHPKLARQMDGAHEWWRRARQRMAERWRRIFG